MKHIRLSALLLCILILVGCTATEPDPPSGQTTQIPEGTSVREPVTDPAQETNPPFLPQYPIRQPNIPFDGMTEEDAHLYTVAIPEALARAEYITTFVHGNRALFNIDRYDDLSGLVTEQVYLIDLPTGKILAQRETETGEQYRYLPSGQIWAVSDYDGKAFLCDDLLHIAQQFDFDTLPDCHILSTFTDDTNYFVWIADGETEHTLHIRDLPNDTEVTVELPDIDLLYNICPDGDALYLVGGNEQKEILYRIDCKSATVDDVSLPTLSFYCENYSYSCAKNTMMVQNPRGEILDIQSDVIPDYLSSVSFGLMIGSNDENRVHCVLDPEGQRAYTLPFADDENYASLYPSENGFILVQCNRGADPHTVFYVWDYLNDSSAAIQTEYYRDSLSQANEALARELSDRFGITVYYDSRGNDYTLPDYLSRPCTSQPLIYSALRELKSFFESFPSGFLEELKAGSVKTTEIYLCGQIFNIDGNGIGNAGALTYTSGSRTQVVVDIEQTDTIVQTLAHEFMHICELRIEATEAETGIPYRQLWDSFNPAKFSYNDSYTATPPYGYTSIEETDVARIYFIDDYSKTFALEDRARVFEYLFCPPSDPVVFNPLSGGPVTRKAQYLCCILRECFPSLAESDTLVWESGLESFDPHQFDELFTEYKAA